MTPSTHSCVVITPELTTTLSHIAAGTWGLQLGMPGDTSWPSSLCTAAGVF